MTYLFYDIETTGLNKCFDQVLQFAAIRTDSELNEISREEIQMTLNCDVVPSPYAVITHRIGVEQFSKGVCELEGIQKIHALLNTPNTISVGYNSLGFDDEFLRFSFYRNLLPPYTHQYATHCGRVDLYPITLLYYLFKPNHVRLINQDGKVSLKLENINSANQFVNGQAHNAMVDVEVTLQLAKKLFEDKKMWDFANTCFQKKTDENRIDNCESKLNIADRDYTVGFMIDGKIGNASQFIAPVILLGPHLHYKNQTIWLRLDHNKLSKTKNDSIEDTTIVFRKRLGEPPFFLPIKERYLHLFSEDRKKIFEENKQYLFDNSNLFKKIAAHYQHKKYPDVPEKDIDAALYSIPFSTPAEENAFRQFHAEKPSMKSDIISLIPNKIRQEQAIRIMGRHFPAYLSKENKKIFDAYWRSELIDFRNEKKLTVDRAYIEIDEIKKNKVLDDEQKKLLDELHCFLRSYAYPPG